MAALSWLGVALAAAGSARWVGLGATPAWGLAAAAALAGLALEMPAGLRRWRWRQLQKPARLSGHRLHRWVMRHPGRVWLGEGFDWTSHHAQQLHDRMTQPSGRREPCGILALSGRRGTLALALRPGMGHTLVLGAPGTGKTQLFKLLALQAVARGEAVIVLDPKGGHGLRSPLEKAAHTAGRSWFQLLPSHPERSDRINPLAHGRQASELASRIAGLLPAGEADTAFGQFAWMVLNRILEAMLALGETPSLQRLRQHVEDQGKSLLVRLQSQAAERSDFSLDGLAALASHDPTHYGKMILSLTPALESLTAGALGRLISPQPDEYASVRPLLDMDAILRQAGVLYVGLDALNDAGVARALGAMLLADLAALAGNRYRDGATAVPVQVFVDEAAEVSNGAFIQLLNKGRECGFTVTFAVQTLADLEVAMGGEAPARMMTGNAANLVVFRTLDGSARTLWSERVGTTWVRSTAALVSAQRGESAEGWRRGMGAALNQQSLEVPRLTDSLLAQLPDLHFVSVLGSGRVVAGRLPLLEE
jgi:conjugal transfer pilus assembly protein TraD